MSPPRRQLANVSLPFNVYRVIRADQPKSSLDPSFSLFVVTPRLLYEPKACTLSYFWSHTQIIVHERLVVVGDSTVGLSMINTLLQVLIRIFLK